MENHDKQFQKKSRKAKLRLTGLLNLFGQFWHVDLQLLLIRIRHPDFLHRRPPQGLMRGVEFYGAKSIAAAIKGHALQFRRHHGYWPSLLNPKTYSGKMFWHNYFGILPVPRAGNKLLTHEFIPASLAGKVKTAEVYFRSEHAILPSNDKITPGKYILKANHGSGMYMLIEYPLTHAARLQAEAKAAEWLATNYWLDQGEWWYSTFKSEIFIERLLGKGQPVIDWRFCIFDGKLAFIIPTRVENSVTFEIQYLDTEFRPYDPQTKSPLAMTDFPLPQRIQEAAQFAVEIGKPYPLVRVDMFIEDDEIYLSEMTFSPANALTGYTRHSDLALGNNINSLPDFRQQGHKPGAGEAIA